MNITVNPRIFETFNNARVGITIVKNANNTVELDLSQDFTALAAEIVKTYSGQTISEIPKIAAWREAYRTFGAKPKDYPSSIESLLKRVSKGNSFWGINPLVDIYNYVSLKHVLPAGGEDTNKMSGDLQLTFATDNEVPVIVLGKDVEESPKPGEVIYKDDAGTICRRWNWREVARTILTKDTKNCIIVFEALDPVTDDELQAAQQELGELVAKHCGADVRHHILTSNNTLISS